MKCGMSEEGEEEEEGKEKEEEGEMEAVPVRPNTLVTLTSLTGILPASIVARRVVAAVVGAVEVKCVMR